MQGPLWFSHLFPQGTNQKRWGVPYVHYYSALSRGPHHRNTLQESGPLQFQRMLSIARRLFPGLFFYIVVSLWLCFMVVACNCSILKILYWINWNETSFIDVTGVTAAEGKITDVGYQPKSSFPDTAPSFFNQSHRRHFVLQLSCPLVFT